MSSPVQPTEKVFSRALSESALCRKKRICTNFKPCRRHKLACRQLRRMSNLANVFTHESNDVSQDEFELNYSMSYCAGGMDFLGYSGIWDEVGSIRRIVSAVNAFSTLTFMLKNIQVMMSSTQVNTLLIQLAIISAELKQLLLPRMMYSGNMTHKDDRYKAAHCTYRCVNCNFQNSFN